MACEAIRNDEISPACIHIYIIRIFLCVLQIFSPGRFETTPLFVRSHQQRLDPPHFITAAWLLPLQAGKIINSRVRRNDEEEEAAAVAARRHRLAHKDGGGGIGDHRRNRRERERERGSTAIKAPADRGGCWMMYEKPELEGGSLLPSLHFSLRGGGKGSNPLIACTSILYLATCLLLYY